MSLQPQPWPEVPLATAKVARKAFRKGTPAMRIRDELGPLFTDEEFAVAFAARGRPGLSPGQLALVSVLQFAENLSDRQAALQVTARIDWKYALGLELDDEGFDHSVLSGFRARLVEHGLEEKVLDLLLARLSELGLLRAGGRARTDSTHVLAAVRSLNRLEFVGETMRAALEALAVAAPGWLTGVVEPGWDRRYQARVESYRLPASAAGRAELAVTIGRDGFALLTALGAADAPVWLREVPAVDVLRITWIQQYHRTVGDGGTEVAWREDSDLPPGRLRLASPYDLAARYGVKRGSGWLGYKVHLTETCDDGTPNLITNVETTDATVTDQETTPVVHGHLAGRGLLPAEHAVDTGYTSTELFLTSAAEHGVELVGPLRVNTSWQARTPDAFDLSDFAIDWNHQQVTCPNGAVSSSWRTEKARGKPVLKVDFRKVDCTPCPVRARCTSSATYARKLTLRRREQHELLERLRVEQATDAWKKRYDRRAGVEGTIHQATAATGLRHARYHGLDKNHLAHVFAATALNAVRLDAWWTDTPTGRTRTTHFSTLVSTAAA
ncbi:IS1182 family transposase [Parafrankia sp. FMc6]|uniref:IS1182 family transposase n=1 Tax=Parafrankia soli TaxID=2599596 RepID=UPI0034D6B538